MKSKEKCLLKHNFEFNWQLSEQYCTWYMISLALSRLEYQNCKNCKRCKILWHLPANGLSKIIPRGRKNKLLMTKWQKPRKPCKCLLENLDKNTYYKLENLRKKSRQFRSIREKYLIEGVFTKDAEIHNLRTISLQ